MQNDMNYLLISVGIVMVCGCEGAKILGVITAGSKSHQYFFDKVVSTMAEDGHTVVRVTPFTPSTQVENIEDVLLDYNLSDNITENLFQSGSWDFARKWVQLSPIACVDSLLQPSVVKALEQDFDLIIMSPFNSECFLSIYHQKQIPLVLVSSNGLFGTLTDAMGALQHPSVVPHILMPFSHPMSFLQRCINTATTQVFTLLGSMYFFPKIEKECRQRNACSQEMPPLLDMLSESSLAIVNSVRQLEYPAMPVPQNVVYAGGIHITPTKPLPNDIEEWIESSGEAGFIYFSLGSVIKPENLQPEVFDTLMRTFGSLEQKVLVKMNSTRHPNVPANVKVGQWFPQQDILAHPKIRLFVTHGGLLSTQEATYFGVPVVGLPVFSDQFTNMAAVDNQGWGKQTSWKTLQENDFRNLIQDTIKDREVRRKVQQRSLIMRDQSQKPASDVLYWINYVIRHKGAAHIKSPLAKISWFQKHNVDVWLCIGTVLSLCIILAVKAIFLLLWLNNRIFYKIKTD